MTRKYEKQTSNIGELYCATCNRRETLQVAEERHIRRIARRSGAALEN
jgi:uncharacterized Zn finger protein (UPF0148 family)